MAVKTNDRRFDFLQESLLLTSSFVCSELDIYSLDAYVPL